MDSVTAGRSKLDHDAHPAVDSPAIKRAWIAPAITQLPRLSELTLQSVGGDIPCGGGSPGGGSTVCP